MTNAITLSSPSKVAGQNKWVVSVTVNSNINRNIEEYIEKLKFKAVSNKPNDPILSNLVPINYVERGPVASGTSKLSYPMGTWSSSTQYINTETSSPFVYYNGKYYTLISDIGVVCYNKTPGTTDGVKYWGEMSQYSSIYANFLIANNASFGSKNGTIFYNNFMYSQLGVDDEQIFRHYSELENVGDMFYNPDTENIGISKLTGKFIPNTSMDFYTGSISCNKLIEQFDNFYLFDINNTDANKVIFNNTYFMDLNKSHNLNIMSRYLDISKVLGSSVGETYYIARPGVVVLPKYESGVEDGINVFINYPACRPAEKTVYPSFNLFQSINDIDESKVVNEASRAAFESERTYQTSYKNQTWSFVYEEIFTFTNSKTTMPTIPSTGKTWSGNTDREADGWVPDGWYGSDSNVEELWTPEKPYMWMAQRVKRMGDENKPIWSSFGADAETFQKEEGQGFVVNTGTMTKTPILWKIMDCKNSQYNTTIHSTTSNIDTSIEGYVLVCADSGIFDTNNYSKEQKLNENTQVTYWDFSYNKNIDKTTNNDIYINTNTFVWKGYSSNFILLAPGSKLKLKSNLVIEKYIDEYNTSNAATLDPIIKNITNSQGKTVAVVRKKIVGRQWIVENSEDFQPIPLYVKIDNFTKSSDYLDYSKINESNNKSINYSNYSGFVGLFKSDIPFMKNENPIVLGSTIIDFDFKFGGNGKKLINKTYDHSIFHNNTLKSIINYARGTYRYPLIIELNINDNAKTSTWDLSNLSNKANNSTRIYRWGMLDNPYIHISTGSGSNLMCYN